MFQLFKKKDKGPYPRTFAKRLTWRIMITLFCVMSIVSIIIFVIVWLMIYAQATMLCNRLLKSKCQDVENTLSEVYVASVNTVPDIEHNLNRPDRMADIMKRIVELNPEIQSCGISFVDKYYPEKGHWFCPYAARRDSDSIIVMKTIGGQNGNYLQAKWFKDALQAKEGYWSEPFFDSTKQIPKIAWLMPIHDERDSTVAVLGVDVSLTKFRKQRFSSMTSSGTWDADKEIYFFAIDPQGNYLIHPDTSRVVSKNYFDYAKAAPDSTAIYVGHRMTGRNRGHIMTDDNGNDIYIEGEKVMVCYQSLAHTPWSMALVLPMFFVDLFGYLMGGFLFFFILLGLIVVFFAGRRGIKKASQPLRQLAVSADEVAKGNFNTPLPDIQSKDEIQLVRDSFANMQQSLAHYVAELRETTAEKASMESELKIAHDIQMSMLPKIFPPYPERTDIDIYGSLTPAKGVGGDLFDFYIHDELLFFCIGDVSGKGVPASLYMAVTRSLFRNVSAHLFEPEKIVAALNNAQAEGNETNMFVTIFVGVLDLATGLLRYCNAGHDAPLLVGRDVAALPCDPNLPIGVISGFEFERQEILIDSQTTIFLFTDGLNEAEDAGHAQFGDMRIWSVAKKLLAEQRHQPQTFIDEMTNAVHQFVGDAEQSDDLTMLAIQYKGQTN